MAGSNDRSGTGTAEGLWERVCTTGDTAPTFTLVMTLGWSLVAALVLATPIAQGSVGLVVVMWVLALLLWLQPQLFAAEHRNAAGLSRVAGFVVALVGVVSLALSF